MKIHNGKAVRRAIVFLGLAVSAGPLFAEEGMWTFHNLPAAKMKAAYGFAPDQKWLDRVRLSSVRLMDGGSGSFVSKDGLLLTNHHVALGQLQKASAEGRDYVKDGFFARKAGEEIPCPDLEINVLQSMENVTARVQGAVKAGSTDEDANKARKAAIAQIEKESTEATGLRSDVMELYNGGEYWLYRYKKFTDVRLVMAPEIGAAFYGGDPDNFTYPRHAMDFAFFRVYENGKPYRTENYLKWSETGLKKDEMAFVSGHPGSTQRLNTLAQLKTVKELQNPALFEGLSRVRDTLLAYAAQGPEQERQIKDEYFSAMNSLKVYQGRIAALKDPAVMGRKADEEKALREAVEKDPRLSAEYAKAWDQIAQAQEALAPRYNELMYRKFGGLLRGGTLAGLAKTIVNYVDQMTKPNDERWEEFRDSGLESLRQQLFSPAPVHPEMEKALMAMALETSLEKLGSSDPFVAAALQGKTPKQVAEEAVSKTKLLDVEYRKRLIAGGKDAVRASDDPLIQLALRLSPFWTETRTWYEKTIEAVEVAASTLIAKARFAVYGSDTYPDATFTLRLSYGKAAGYEEGTTQIPYKTTFWGLYGRAASFDNQAPFDLPAKVAAAKDKVNKDAPLNFVTTNDIIGGNSGSPVINKAGELVGLIFDGNIQSLVGDFLYDGTQNRAISVHSAAILEALVNIYGMGELAAELTRRTGAGS